MFDRIEEVSCKFTGEDLILRDFGEVQFLVYQGKQNAREISFCGKALKVWEPDSAVDDSTLQQLDGRLSKTNWVLGPVLLSKMLFQASPRAPNPLRLR